MKLNTRHSTGIITVTIQTANGRRTVSTGTTDPKLAKQFIKTANLESIEVLAKAGQITQSLIHKLTIGGSKTVDQVIAEWEEWSRSTATSDRSSENYICFVKAWARDMKLNTLRICDVKEKQIADWVNAPGAGKFGTRRVKLAAIHSFFRFCSIREYSNDPSRLVKIKDKELSHEQKEPRTKEPFTDAEVSQIIRYLKERIQDLDRPKTARERKTLQRLRFWYCAVIIGRYAGLRLGDICSLEWSCFTKPGRMIVWTDKRNRRVELEIDDHLFEGVSAIPTNHRKHCFPEQDELIRHKTKRSKLSVQFMRILEACGIEGHSFHDLRHTLASNLHKTGKNRTAIAKILGHASTTSTEDYIHE